MNLLDKDTRENFCYFGMGKDSWERERERGHRTLIIRSDTLDFIKAKTACFQKILLTKKKKGKLQNGRKYSQYLYLRKDLKQEYMKNSYNAIAANSSIWK